jgi:hypothetical protein
MANNMSPFFSYLSWFQIALLMVALMSGIFSLFREVVLINNPEKAKDGHLFWRCVFITFIISAIWLWVSEHQQTMDLRVKLDELTKPQFVIDANQVFAAPINGSDAMILVMLHVTDLGAQSVIKEPKIILAVNGSDLSAQWLGLPDRPIIIQQPNGVAATFPPNEYLMTKAGEKPIDRNGAAEGFIWFRVSGLKGTDFSRATVRGEIHDASNKPYRFETELSSANLNSVFPNPQ